MAKQPHFDAFFRALPVLGRDGTLWNIQPSSPAAGHVHAKTGTLGGYDALNRRMLLSAKGLAGYVVTASGRRYAFAAYVNNVSVSLDPADIARVAGQALGEIAAAGYSNLP
jgi:D-alanyl-D-alanine carboxypeptidase/D-alanyl-D-alanine-endopeptidase (penicillin-binding protein 4)